MRVAWLLLPLLASASAFAPPDRYSRVWAPYRAQLAAQCPAKHLDWLAPAELRDALDAYQARVPASLRREMAHAEALRCAASVAGATCGNFGDLEVAERHHRLPQVVATVCRSFAVCHGQSDCDSATSPATSPATS